MPDDTTQASTTNAEGGGETVESLRTKLTEASSRAEAATKDADQAKRYLVDLVARMGQAESDRGAPVQTQAAADATPDELLSEFKENPVGLLDRHFAARMGPILHDHLDTQGKFNRQAFIDRNKEDWDAFGKEVDAFMSPMSPSTRAKPGSWEEGMNYIKGKHIDDLVDRKLKAREEAEKKSQLEGRGASGGGSNGRGGKFRLSDSQKAVAKGFGMTEEEWVKNMTPSEKGEEEEPF